jgi:hypothetical protein
LIAAGGLPEIPCFNDATGAVDPANPMPVLANPGMRATTAASLHREDSLQFSAYIGGGAGSGAAANLISPLVIDPTDNRPVFMPLFENAGSVPQSFYLTPDQTLLTEIALRNAGYSFWPNVAVMTFQPQVLEDLIVSLEVTNGLTSDTETFPVTVTNYPVENYPPVIERVDDQMAMVGQPFIYPLVATDADSAIYCVGADGCQTTHPTGDQFTLTWSASLAGMPSYQYGPWSEPIINSRTGIVSFTPQFEGAYPMTVQVVDDRGYSSIAEFTIFCANPGTQLNHAPIILRDWDRPQVANAGELFILDTQVDVQDPDGDRLYYACNIGSIGEDSNGNIIWSFQTQYPGYYVVDVVAMDGRGGYATFTIDLEVRPWWSF